MIERIEQQIVWLEKHRTKSGSLFHKRLGYILSEISTLDQFVNLKINEKIQGYWVPIIQSWRDRLKNLFNEEDEDDGDIPGDFSLSHQFTDIG